MRLRPVLALALLAASCGGSPDSAALDAADLVEKATAAMMEVESARFEMTRSGAVVTVEGMAFDRAVGQYGAPESAQAVLQVRVAGITVELGTISIASRTWLTDPLTGRWHELRPGAGFNPAVLFDPEVGWVALLQDLTEVTLVESAEGTHHLSGRVPAERIAAITAGVAPPQSVLLDLWLDAGLRIVRLEFSTIGDEGQSDWVIVMTDYGASVQIDPPATQ